jgi:flagellar hook-basal body complex protein FliE
MNLEAVSQIAGADASVGASLGVSSPLPFSERLQAEFEALNTKMASAATELQELAAGKPSDLHHVMLSLEDAKLSFQLLVQVRNKVLEAYQELMRMQV